MGCSFFEKHVMEYLNGTLGSEVKKAFESHLASCTSCAKEKENMDRLTRRIHDQEVPEPGEQYWNSFNRKVFSKIDQLQERGWSSKILLPRWAAATIATSFIAVMAVFFYIFWISEFPSSEKYEKKILMAIQDATPDQAEGITEEMPLFSMDESPYFQDLDDLFANGKEEFNVESVIEEAIIPYSLLEELDESEKALLVDQMELEMG